MADVSSYKVYGTLPTIPEEQVQKLIEQSEGGTLPEVTTTDNGKVLTVVEGEWDKANAGGGGILFVHPDENLALDKTWQEIKDADYTVLKDDTGTGGNVDIMALGINLVNYAGSDYQVGFYSPEGGQMLVFSTDSADGYPAFVQPDGD